MNPVDHNLPPLLQDISDRLGLAAAYQVATQLGGLRVSIPLPQNLHSEHILKIRLGVELANAFCRQYGGDTLEIPRGVRAIQQIRNLRILADYASGDSPNTLARRYHLTGRGIRKIIAKAKHNIPVSSQMSAI